MGKKEKTPQEELEVYIQDLREDIRIWKERFYEGSTDPFYQCGCALDLKRNHILHELGHIKEICDTYEWEYPDDYYEAYIPAMFPINYEVTHGKFAYRRKNWIRDKLERTIFDDKSIIDPPLLGNFYCKRVWNDEVQS